ncbi:MAG: hypothetical protein NT099_09030 [Candidatus Saganbacteria bacterium]|nr:hypothetical protein [Candidatus Saganbacteria bacterium]
MPNKTIFLLILLLIISLFSTTAFADFGTRPMAMGGAFTAIADDSNAAFWNPAGFAINPGTELSATALINNRNQQIGDNHAALKMGFEMPLDSPFHWILGVGAVAVAGAYTAQYLSDQGVLKKNWGRSGEKTDKTDSMAEEVKAEDTGTTTSRKEIIGIGIDKSLGNNPSPTPTTTPTTNTTTTPASTPTQTVIVNNNYYQPGYLGPIPLGNPLYLLDPQRPTYYENREYANNPKQTPAGKAQFGFGLTWMRDNNATLDQNTSWYTASLATAWEETVALGANLNVYDLEIPSTKAKGIGGGLDFGILIRSYKRLFIGLCAKEVLTTDIHWTNGATTRYAMNVNAGIALRPIPEITIAADAHNIFQQNAGKTTMHYGLELIPLPGISLRGGFDEKDGQMNQTLGAGLKLWEIQADYAMLGGTYNQTQMVSLAWKF